MGRGSLARASGEIASADELKRDGLADAFAAMRRAPFPAVARTVGFDLERSKILCLSMGID